MVKKKIIQAFVLLANIFLFTIISFGGVGINVYASEASNDKDEKYLSDLEYYSANTEKSRPVIKDAVDANGTKMQIKIEGAWYTFDKGLFTHTGGTNATATVTVIYNLENLDYNYFTTYVGLNKSATKGDGVRFNVGTSVDGKE